ncbi:MAG: hypothetical protein K2P87_04080 [Lachnospiraceae bacterium]|nr:hypothetical protein [Lachnospiraceae bacterium]
MRRNKNKDGFGELEEKIIHSLQSKNVPLLILDEKWLEIFPEHLQNVTIRGMVSELNALLKKQGKQNDDIKGLRRYKSQMMQEIVQYMGADETAVGRLKQRKLDKNQKKILELNEQLKETEDSLSDMPYRIRQANAQLMLESTRVCYDRFRVNKGKMQELEDEISSLREKLRLRVLEKQEREMQDEKMYAYLHSLLGVQLMEELDRTLAPGNEDE